MVRPPTRLQEVPGSRVGKSLIWQSLDRHYNAPADGSAGIPALRRQSCMNVNTDQALLRAASLMKEDALVKIFDRYSRELFRYALRLTGDAVMADHVVGDVFANLLDQLSSGSGPRFHLRSYLYKSAYHLIVDEARYIRRRAPLEAASTLPHDDLYSRA